MSGAWTIGVVLLVWVALGIPVSLVAGRLLARNNARYPVVLPRQRTGPAHLQLVDGAPRRTARGLTVIAALAVVSTGSVTAAAAMGSLPPSAQGAAAAVVKAISPFEIPSGVQAAAPAPAPKPRPPAVARTAPGRPSAASVVPVTPSTAAPAAAPAMLGPMPAAMPVPVPPVEPLTGITQPTPTAAPEPLPAVPTLAPGQAPSPAPAQTPAPSPIVTPTQIPAATPSPTYTAPAASPTAGIPLPAPTPAPTAPVPAPTPTP